MLKDISSSPHIIEFKNVTKKLRNQEIIKDISIKLPSGKFVAIMGPSGAGKTTFLILLQD